MNELVMREELGKGEVGRVGRCQGAQDLLTREVDAEVEVAYAAKDSASGDSIG